MKTMLNVIIFILILYTIICIFLYVYQDKLIFFPPEPISQVYASFKENEISFEENNKLIHGWTNSINQKSRKIILYFGGNAEDVVYFNAESENFNVSQVFMFNYPGYGKSQGKPSQQSLYTNSLDVYDHIVKKYNIKADDIIIVGRSLGSSVATYLAANRKASGLIIITPFDSIENIAAQQYKIFPVKFLLKHAFPTIDNIIKVQTPVLVLAAEEDEVIADRHLQNLKKVMGNNFRLIRYVDVGHNTIQTHNNYYVEINDYIESLKKIN